MILACWRAQSRKFSFHLCRKDARAKYREKYQLPESPPRSDAEEESESEDEEDGFGPSKKVEQDPMDRKFNTIQCIKPKKLN